MNGIRVTALAALFGSVSAFAEDENKPIDLTTTITVKNRAVCSLAVTHSGSAAATVRYTKGATVEQSTIELQGGQSQIAVKAVGGDACDISSLTFAYTDNAAGATEGTNFRHILTADGKGLFPMQYNISSASFKDKDGNELDRSAISTTASSPAGADLKKLSDYFPVTTSAAHKGIRRIGANPVGVIPGIPLMHYKNGGSINTALAASFGSAIDRRYDVQQGDRDVRFVGNGAVVFREAVIAVAAVPGDGFYSVESGKRADDVVADDEELEFKATLTVTAS
ncbi:hypothetical protein [Pseudomonas canadensis]|uniref:hypothetical protein n=1 Tax=Pseudomonas canadensis TaxID=915099 RepID=UPI003B9EEDDF